MAMVCQCHASYFCLDSKNVSIHNKNILNRYTNISNMLFCYLFYQLRNHPSKAVNLLNLYSFGYCNVFSFIKTPSNWIFWLLIDKNHLKILCLQLVRNHFFSLSLTFFFVYYYWWLFQCSKPLWFLFNPRWNGFSGYITFLSDVFVGETFF